MVEHRSGTPGVVMAVTEQPRTAALIAWRKNCLQSGGAHSAFADSVTHPRSLSQENG